MAVFLVLFSASSQDQEGKPVLIGSLEHEDVVSGLRFSDDGRTLTAVVHAKEKAVRWNLKTMKPQDVVDLSTSGITDYFTPFSADGRLLLTRFTVSVARNNEEEKNLGQWVRVWDLETGKQKAAYHGPYLGDSNLSPDGKLLAVIERYEPLEKNGKVVKLLDVVTGKDVLTVPSKKGTWRLPYGVDFSPNSKTLALSIHDFEKKQAAVELWDVGSRRVRATLTGSVGPMNVVFTPDGRTIATWASNEPFNPVGEAVKVELKLWDADTGCEKAELKGHRQTVSRAVFSPDGKLLATGTGSLPDFGALLAQPERVGRPPSKTELKLWNVAAGKERAVLGEHDRPINLLAFSPDGRLLASWSGHSRAGQLRLWDVAGGKRLPGPAEWDRSPLGSLAFSPDSKVLATGGGDGVVRLWDIAGVGKER